VFHAEVPQATVSEGLAQGKYTWRLGPGFEPATLRSTGIGYVPPRLTCLTL